MSLSEEQNQFISHDPKKHARLLAGPGTGKSYTSVRYLERVLEQYPNLLIQYITFTRAATNEYAQKISESALISTSLAKPSTVHGFALTQLLKNHSSDIPYPLRIPDTWETKNLIQPQISRLLRKLGHNAPPSLVQELELEMSSGFASLDPDKILRSEKEPELKQAYVGVWRKHRSDMGYVLLNELTYRAARMLEDLDQTDIGVNLLIVDEYQDLNEADLNFLLQSSLKGASIIAIGDDDQSIYSWRHAAPHGIRDFPNKYVSEVYQLTSCRRCGGHALEVANQLIMQEPSRPKKAPLAPYDDKQTDIHYLKFRSNQDEAKHIAKIIKYRIESGINPGDIVILVRSSLTKWLRELVPALSDESIPVGIQNDFADVLAKKDIRLLLAKLKLVEDPSDSLSWMTAIKLIDGIGNATIDQLVDACESGGFMQAFNTARADKFSKFRRSEFINSAIETLSTEVDQLRDEVSSAEVENWGEWMLSKLDASQLEDAEKEVILEVGKELGVNNKLHDFVNQLEPLGKELSAAKSNGVRIMTISQSKGLTVNTAIILGVEEGLIPMPEPRGILSEEIRLLYVAITRATDLTIMTWSSTRSGSLSRVGRSRSRSWEPRRSCQLLEGLITAESGESYVDSNATH